MNELSGKKIIMIVVEGFEDMEPMYQLFRLRYEAYADVTLTGPGPGETLRGKQGMQVTTESAIHNPDPGHFDALVIPGGRSPDHIRIFPEVIKLVHGFDKTGKPITSICRGLQILFTARLLKGKQATGWKSLVVEVENADAKYVDRPLVKSQQYILSRSQGDPGFFCDAIIRSLSPEKSESAAEMVQELS